MKKINRYTLTLQQIIKSNIKIFDFDYPVHREDFREEFEKLFIDYFLLEEIAHETVGQFKLRLKSKLNLIMPYYNEVYKTLEMNLNITESVDVTETYTKEILGKSSSSSKNLYKDAPKTKIDIDKFDIVTNLSKSEGEGQSEGVEKFSHRRKGNIGITTDADNVMKYRKYLIKLTEQIFETELSSLFMGVF